MGGRAAVVGAILASSALVAYAGGSRFQATSRPARSSARLAYTSTDVAAGISKGAGTDPAAIAAAIFIRNGADVAHFDVPAGAFVGTSGWTANDAVRAAFLNRSAPDGPTGVMRTNVTTSRRVRLLAKTVGDGTTPLAFSAPPTNDIQVAYVITNAGEATRHCTRFAAVDCKYATTDGGTGWKVRCSRGIPDPGCGAAPVCGNGIREGDEQCDGGPGCAVDCTQGLTSCCAEADQCVAAPVFTLQTSLMDYCASVAPGSTPVPGGVCESDGTCADRSIDPLTVCCQRETECYDQSVSSTAGLWYFQYYCLQGTGLGGPRHIVGGATCGAGAVCVPQ